MKDNGKLVWIDLEMTGLNPFTDWVLEVATIVTNSQLDILAEGPVIAPSISRESRHRACDDIKELSAELKHYGDCLIKKR